MIDRWEWIMLIILMVLMYLTGYYRLLDRIGAGLAAWWARRKFDVKWEFLKDEHDLELQSLRDRLRQYFNHIVSIDLWYYDLPRAQNKIAIDTDMNLIICNWPHKSLNAFYTDLVDDWKEDLPLQSKHTLGYKVVNDWWVYFAGELYKTGDMIRHEREKPKTVKQPLPEIKKQPTIDGSDES